MEEAHASLRFPSESWTSACSCARRVVADPLHNSDGGTSWGVVHSIIGGCLVQNELSVQGVANSGVDSRTLAFKVWSVSTAAKDDDVCDT